ncbi:hypothetical protein QA648_26165 (plasmid) [Rhizobium sp. CB3171]|uniref:hypothetical protein n=1 Tax=Rhizobium sp. CB3171 TaxID=3039157 RepID=UPI0024B11B00|nr:hypothetical protein [Rhizobium sp. CB3171]WFU04277.1 hypothetical protein QA648_26165 [Rhizobium sp. CB3171]
MTSTAGADVSMFSEPTPSKDGFLAAGGSAGEAVAVGISHWLSLAAAPTFAIMALLTAAVGDQDMICSAMSGALPLGGMVSMYLLMSVFHLTPWLRLLSRQQNGARRP